MILSFLILAFIVVPIAELALLLYVGDYLGPANTILLVIVTGVAGASLARWQGFIVMSRIHSDLAEGRIPAPRLLDGLMILVAGLLLVTPGLMTDTIGFLLLVPPVRREIRVWCRRAIEKRISRGRPDITIGFH